MREPRNGHGKFPGFSAGYLNQFIRYPMELEKWWCILTPSENAALLLIIRQTVGYNKTGDGISLSQFEVGNGKNLLGAGISESTARRAIEGLENKGFITVARYEGRESYIKLRFADSQEDEPSADVKRILYLFGNINPERAVEFLENKKEYRSAEKLVKSVGLGKIEWLITQVLPETNELEYFPTITSPSELLEKGAKLQIMMRREAWQGEEFE
jgi:hypothetical protein